ncbi:MAG: sigma-70 family RNA polymerase sigma factor [Deltaproteobacteria bacterium]|nr:sigma-70 family RNA polymerase sigma factor [Deltaproteobacteria bacterium]
MGPGDDLIGGLKRGEAAAFDRAYEQYRSRLYGYLARMARRRELAEDLLQETWLRLAQHASQLDDDTDLGAWLFTVARNLFLSHVRSAMTGADRLHTMSFWESQATYTTPFDLTSANETQQRLELALLELPIDYREVLVLVVIEHLEPIAVARILGIRPEAVRKRLERARTMLAERVGDRPHHGGER